MVKILFIFVFVISSCLLCLAQSSSPLLIENLTVNQTDIAFSHAGKIWSVGRGGGEAKLLSTGDGEAGFPVFSPDGSQMAFSRNNGDAWNVFLMPVGGGGEPKQLTHIPEDDRVVNWTPDGKNILFVSHRDEELNYRLYTISTEGVLPQPLPFPYGFGGSYSGDGRRIAYLPTMPFIDWRFYRGGLKAQIWLANLGDGSIEKLPHGNFNDKFPMWIGDKIYFVSDRTGNANLFVYDLKTKRAEQLTKFDKYGITFAAAGSGSIAFVRDGRIYLYDLAGKTAREISIQVSFDKSELKEREVNAARTIDLVAPSASAERLAINSRGEVLIFDAASGETKNLTQTSGTADRYPAISPDNRSVAYFSDESGEYQLFVRVLENGAVKKIPIEQNPSFYRELAWSPDSKRLVFSDKRLALWTADVESGAVRRIDRSTYSYQEQWFPQWSPDSRWIVYSKHLANRVRTIFVYDAETGKTHQITDGMTHTESPVFDQNGKYLYFIWSPNAGTSEYGWGVLSGMLARPLVRRNVGLIILPKDEPSPLLPNGQPNPEARIGETAPKMQIDFENIRQRVMDLPLSARDYTRLTAGKPGNLYALVTEWGTLPGPLDSPPQTLYRYEVTKPPNFEKIAERIDNYEISNDREHLLFMKGSDIFLVRSGSPPKEGEGKLDLSKLKITVDPQAEWRQIYHEAWRIMRDWFYDPQHHGQNLKELEEHYAAYLPNISRRDDLNSLMQKMLDYISVSHLNVLGGDVAPPGGRSSRIGMLGADYEINGGRYRFKRIYRTSHYDDPSGYAPAPLDQPGFNVREGEYLLAVNDKNIDAAKNIYSYFEGTAGRPTKIRIAPNPNGDGARMLTVMPLAGENGLRRANWSERNRRLVEEKSGGKLGYIYVGDYGRSIMDFIRGLTGFSNREGIIIDQRFNGGGITSDYLIEWLQRKPLYYYTFREGDDIATPVNPGPAAKVLLINEYNFSAAETFAFMYKLGKVGPVVGRPTYGGGIGPYVFTPRFIDGGRVRLPNRAAYDPSGTSWGIENIGVMPDHPVEILPKDWLAGRDPQLEKAVEVALSEIEKNQISKPKKPKYPIHP